MELIFLDRNFRPVSAPLDSCVSLIWSRRYFECGTFSAKFPADKIKPYSGAVYVYNPDAGECARIDSLSVDESEGATYSGRMLESLLCDRIIEGKASLSGSAEDIVREVVSANAIDARPIEGLSLGELCGLTNSVTFETDYDNLSEWIYGVLKPYGASYRMDFDLSSGIVFSVVKGVNRCSDQTENGRVLFSADFENISSLEFEYTDADMKNVAYVCGGDGTVVKAVDPDTTEDEIDQRRELFIRADDIKLENFPRRIDYERNLMLRGMAALRNYGTVFSVKGEALPFAALRYRSDYDIGDLCEVYIKSLGRRCRTRIVSVDEVWENGCKRVVTYFGDEVINIKRYIKRELKYDAARM